MKNISMKNVVMGSVLAIAAVSSLTANAATICSGGIATDGPQVAVGTFVKIAFTPKCSANVNLSGTDTSATVYSVGANSVKGSRTFAGSTAGGAVCAVATCATSPCTTAEATTADSDAAGLAGGAAPTGPTCI